MYLDLLLEELRDNDFMKIVSLAPESIIIKYGKDKDKKNDIVLVNSGNSKGEKGKVIKFILRKIKLW